MHFIGNLNVRGYKQSKPKIQFPTKLDQKEIFTACWSTEKYVNVQ